MQTKKLFFNYRNRKWRAIGSLPPNFWCPLKSTSEALLAGVEILGIKRHGDWKSPAVVESYVEDSLQNRIEFTEKILPRPRLHHFQCILTIATDTQSTNYHQ